MNLRPSLRRLTALATLAGGVLATAPAWAADALLPAFKLIVRDRGANRGRIVLVAKSSFLTAPSSDPTVDGGTFEVLNPGTGETAAFDLPGASWLALGGGYKYVNPAAAVGPSAVKLVVLFPAKILKVRAKSPGVTLDEPSQGTLGVRLTIGGDRYCATCSGAVRDEQGRFVARSCAAPGTCPEPPAGTTTSTTPVSTTTSTTLALPCAQDTRTLVPGCASLTAGPCGTSYTIGSCGAVSCAFVAGACQACSPSAQEAGLCINTCRQGPTPVCPGDSGRTFVGYGDSAGCAGVGTAGACATSFQIDGDGRPVSCTWTGSACETATGSANVCPVCAGQAALALADTGGCGAYDGTDALTCEARFAFPPASPVERSCFWDGDATCQACSAFLQDVGECSNACATCPGDPSRQFVGGPGLASCGQIGDENVCNDAFHLSGCGYYASCYWDAATAECRGCGPNNEKIGACTNACD